MADELVFYTNPMSRGRIVRWMLEEVGAPYRTEVLDYGTTMKAPGYLAINPMGKVPAIRHGDVGERAISGHRLAVGRHLEAHRSGSCRRQAHRPSLDPLPFAREIVRDLWRYRDLTCPSFTKGPVTGAGKARRLGR